MAQKRRRIHIPIVLVVLSVTFGAFRTVAAKDNWTKVTSKNFSLIGNASEKDIRQVANRLEQFRNVFGLLFPTAQLNSPVPTTVVVFKSDNSYKPFKTNQNVAGYFQGGEDVNYITLTTERESGEQPFRIIFHEYVHLLIDNTLGATVPLWFNEGLAEYYSTFNITDENRKVILGDLVANHVLYLRENRMLPLRTLFAVDQKSPYYNEGDKMNIFYAESWMLMHYLLQGENRKRQPQVSRFIDLAASGVSVDQAFQQAFQTDIDTFERGFKLYIQGSKYTATEVSFQKKLDFDSELESMPLTEADAQAYLGDLLLHTRRLTDAETHLQQALTLSPESPMAEASLGMLRVRQNRLTDAREHLKKAVAGNSQNYLAHYYYAYALSGLAMEGVQMVRSFPPEAVDSMRAELRKAIELKPDYPESYSLLCLVNIVLNEDIDQTISLLQRALAISRGNQRMMFMLAQLYLRKEEFAEAKRVLEPLARNSPDPSMRKQAQIFLEGIQKTEEQLAKFKEWQAERAGQAKSANDEISGPPQLGGRNGEIAGEGGDDWNSLLNRSLKKPNDGESRTQGLLTAIECTNRGMIFKVRASDGELQFHSNGFAGLRFTAFTDQVSGEILCGVRKPENPVVITFAPAKPGSKFNGEATVVEFVPENFVLKP